MNGILILLIIAVELGVNNAQIDPNEVCTTIDKCPAPARSSASKQCGRDGGKTKVWCKIPCVTPDYKNGICTPWKLCASFRTLVLQLSSPTQDKIPKEDRSYLKRFECNKLTNSSEPYVCCTELENDVAKSRSRSTSRRRSRLRSTSTTTTTTERYANEEYCGIQNDLLRIVGGTEAQLGQFPWLALLQYKHRGQVNFKCGGALINRRYVLTAAHCIDSYRGTLINVVLGKHDKTSVQDCINGRCSVAQVIPVEKTIQHPGWIGSTRRFADDLALVRLSRNANYDAFVRPICLPSKDFLPKWNEDFTVAGWGQTGDSLAGPSSDVKQYATISLQSKSSCINTVPIPLAEGQICLGGGQADSCNGDSGGPLMRRKIQNGREIWSIIGIISVGYNNPCGTPGRPGIYTNVSHYVEWIKQNSRYQLL